MRLVITIGTRPELIRLSKIIKECQKYYETFVIWTSQNFEISLSTQFFEEFNIKPDLIIPNKENLSGNEYISHIIYELDLSIGHQNPDAILFLGDTNSCLATAIVGKKLGIPLFHLEAGNRCYDNERVPEEINRKMIDSVVDWHLCYTQRAREQLLLEGKHPSKCMVVGNPILEVISEYELNEDIEDYYLATIHRKENIDNQERLVAILRELGNLDKPVKISNHPSLKSKIDNLNLKMFSHLISNLEFIEPPNFKDFLQLENNAKCIITDSGTVPEEATILGKPCVLLRYSTERPELLENNNMVVCSNPNNLKISINIAINTGVANLPNEYHDDVSNNVIKLLMRYDEK